MKSVSVPYIPAIVGRPIQRPDDTYHGQAELCNRLDPESGISVQTHQLALSYQLTLIDPSTKEEALVH
ncbi:hypothetical protein [Yersinia aleksiciae]|uniref:hypothetical protein n=1 Tax=Yersinia aleksiciae TaxID=263819 RepID=UPI001187723D|nr:hypothetical protein [Yersinia aleksiciae]MDA5497917.1 hypothetical protein [Yersinia aleksiciae]NIK99729.1 hypothetical protein [Yersinia aleksiciae]WQC71535.1 hypothetical protein N0K21_03450 [Yersinia aleksiciae]